MSARTKAPKPLKPLAPPQPTGASPVAARMRLAWGDFHTVLTVARHGRLAAASEALAVTHATLLRQLAAIESRLGARLFDRERGRYTPTAAGDEVVRAAGAIEPLARQAELRVMGQDLRPSGDVRVAVAGIVIDHLLPPVLAQFAQAFPEVRIELVSVREHVSLARREADVAIRITDGVADWLVGRRIATVEFKVYGLRRPGLRGGLRPLAELASQPRWIGLERDVRDLKFDRWLEVNVPAAHIVLRVDSFGHALTMVRAGLGIALLPAFVETSCPDLQPLCAPIQALRTPMWLVTHAELRHTMRVKVLMQAIGPALSHASGG